MKVAPRARAHRDQSFAALPSRQVGARQLGFSLIEVVVALALGISILAVAIGVLAEFTRQANQKRVRTELAREAALFSLRLSSDARGAGLGVPPSGSPHANGAIGAFYGPILVAAGSQLAFLGDFTRPHAQYQTFGTLASFVPSSTHPLTEITAWHTENNGTCAPSGTSGCSTADASVFFPGVAGCNASSGVADRVCPWGLKRVGAGDRLQIVAGDGSWIHTAAASPLAMHDPFSTGHGPGQPAAFVLGAPQLSGTWTNVTGGPPVHTPGMGWVTTLDRVFYRYVAAAGGGVIERRQCWGDPDPADADFPSATATAIPANPDQVSPAGVVNTCTRWERMLRDVKSASFAYFDESATAVAEPINTALLKQSVRRIDYHVVLEKRASGFAVSHEIAGTVGLRN